MYNAIKKLILISCSVGFILTLVILVIFRGNMNVYKANVFSISNALLLVFGLIILALTLFINLKFGNKIESLLRKNTVLLLSISLFLLLAVRLCICYFGYFTPGWDAGTILKTTESLVRGTDVADPDYYSMFPNNLLIVWIYTIISKIAVHLGIGNIGLSLLAFQSVICVTSVLMVFLITKDMTGSLKTAWFAYLTAFILIGLSPWFLVAYSDATGIVLPLVVVRLYQISGKCRKHICIYILRVLLGLVSAASFYIKPQLLISFIAVIIIDIAGLFKPKTGIKELKSTIANTVSVLIGVALFLTVYRLLITPSLNIEIDPEKSVSVKHYIMIGLNDSTDGIYSDPDYQYARSFDTREERDEAEMDRAMQRLEAYDTAGLLSHLADKHVENYGDGTFAWGVEGEFFEGWGVRTESGIGKIIRFTISGDGLKYKIFTNTFQMIWLTVMFLVVFVACSGFSDKKRPASDASLDIDVLLIMVLSIIGLTLFELLFEARARYLFCYAPVYVILAAVGYRNISHMLFLKHKGSSVITYPQTIS